MVRRTLLGLVLVLLAAGALLAVDGERRRALVAFAGARLGIAALAEGEPVDRVFRTALVERGPIRAAVLATGTLQPTRVVQVSSQTSGQVIEVLGEFNAEVRAGEIIARLDPTTLKGRLEQARADLAVAEATIGTKTAAVDRARAEVRRIDEAVKDGVRNLERLRQLAKSGTATERSVEQADLTLRQAEMQALSTRAEVAMAEAELASARALVLQKRAAVTVAETDLERTIIRAPIDGVIIDRTVEVGQTVAASLQAPTLFQIAAELASMQLEASIDEADVGRVREGARATFTVDAYPGRTFEGRVAQVRRAGKAVQNVVTYTAVATADNSSLALFPGMTATVRIIVAEKHDALKVPAAALRFRPEDPPGGPDRRRAREIRPAEIGGKARLHVVGPDGQPRPVMVTTGVATETEVEIVEGTLQAGDKVIIGRTDAPGRPRVQPPLGF